ncbi:MAG: hypothetical protein KAI47_22200, partial [Deltaproteobacteria bacterium]|nr:hypothetical protein [Deltaproteobacteria bacterium]
MNTAWKWLLAAVAISFVTTGCVEERSFFITTNLSQCAKSTDGEGGSGGLAFGVLDISPSGTQLGYVFYPELQNDMVSSSSGDQEPERNRLLLRRFEVELDLGTLGEKNP